LRSYTLAHIAHWQETLIAVQKPHLPVSLTICMMVQSAIPLILITTPVSLVLLLAHIYKDTNSLHLSIWTFHHMHLKPLQATVSLL